MPRPQLYQETLFPRSCVPKPSKHSNKSSNLVHHFIICQYREFTLGLEIAPPQMGGVTTDARLSAEDDHTQRFVDPRKILFLTDSAYVFPDIPLPIPNLRAGMGKP